MKASIFIVGHPSPKKVEFGADQVQEYDEAVKVLQKQKYAVIVVADKDNKKSLKFLGDARKLNPDAQTILVGSTMTAQGLQKAINDVGLFKIIPDFEANILQQAVREALEEYELIKQNQAFLALVQEQNLRLQHLSSLLEEKVKAREKYLNEAREKLLTATKRTEALNSSIVAIHRSLTKQEIEKHLNEALQVSLGLSWTKILFKNESFLYQVPESGKSQTTIFSAPLFRNMELLGHIYFAREKDRPFTSSEDDFLLQVGDAVGLAIDRLMTLEAIESLKQEWDSTFDSITDPVSIIDENYRIVRVNKSYAQKTLRPVESLKDSLCYEALFGRSKPCDNCRLGKEFDLGVTFCRDKSEAQYIVRSHQVLLSPKATAYATFYRDISQEQRIQRQILESSKMAEIGTIGSSIAHEINNPLGGMIAFIQIMKSGLKPDQKIYEDISEMEKAAIRCKSIVENLLAFTRQSGSADKQLTRIGDLVKLAANIIELQARGLGISIEKRLDDSDLKVSADKNQLVQVLVNIMQNSCEALAERMSSGERINSPRIVISSQSSSTKDEVVLGILDYGTGISGTDLARVFTPFFTTKDKSKNPGLGLSVSYQIVKDHAGQMEISSVHGQQTTVKITLPIAKSPTH